jgi:hypothetical protein
MSGAMKSERRPAAMNTSAGGFAVFVMRVTAEASFSTVGFNSGHAEWR